MEETEDMEDTWRHTTPLLRGLILYFECCLVATGTLNLDCSDFKNYKITIHTIISIFHPLFLNILNS